MNKDDIRIVELPAMKIISFHGFGESPEEIALSRMFEWTEKHQYFIHKEARCFGFNNPDPTPGSSNYGYEIWLVIQDTIEAKDTKVRQFEGGLYAVAHCDGKLESAAEFIPATWKKLMEWLENSSYQMGKHQWLEEQLKDEGLTVKDMYEGGKISLDLYMPIKS